MPIARMHAVVLDCPDPPALAGFYQALVGIWPGKSPQDLAARLKAYMLKAAREAKLRTSWINPDTDYEAALERFVTESLKSPLFLKEAGDTVARVAHLGLLVGLSQALLKVASPGIPDYYQGSELWDFSLVDPDNRRPVDYAVREKFLKQLERSIPRPEELLENLADGRAKLHVIRTGLALRRRWPALFQGGEYVPLYADGAREARAHAFRLGRPARQHYCSFILAFSTTCFQLAISLAMNARNPAESW